MKIDSTKFKDGVCRNVSVCLRQYPGQSIKETDFELRESSISVDGLSAQLQQGGAMVQNICLSMDPYMRGLLNSGSHIKPGDVIQGYGVCRVVANFGNSAFQCGQVLMGIVGWELFSILGPKATTTTALPSAFSQGHDNPMFVIPDDEVSQVPLSYHLGVLGMPGLTAYPGLSLVIPPAPTDKETVFVSAASGAVGQLVGQLAKLRGCRVIGTAGSQDKVEHLVKSFKYDAAFNYKEVGGDLVGALRRKCPNGIDFYFDNVGGSMLEAAIEIANPNARIVCCGAISGYDRPPEPVRNLDHTVFKCLKIHGFLVGMYEKAFQEFRKNMKDLIKKDMLRYEEEVVSGIEFVPSAFIGLFHGRGLGKLIVML